MTSTARERAGCAQVDGSYQTQAILWELLVFHLKVIPFLFTWRSTESFLEILPFLLALGYEYLHRFLSWPLFLKIDIWVAEEQFNKRYQSSLSKEGSPNIMFLGL